MDDEIGSERWSNLLRSTQLGYGRARIQIHLQLTQEPLYVAFTFSDFFLPFDNNDVKNNCEAFKAEPDVKATLLTSKRHLDL